MEDRDWLIIQALHAEKNITKAAQSLYMSQPALTSRLQHIEREFGVQIVHRSTKGIRFTSEGEYLVNSSVEIVDRLNKIRDEIRGIANENSGTIEIGASNYFTMYTLPNLLKQFKEIYPCARFKVTTDWTKNIFSLLYGQKIHVGFVSVDYGGCKDMHMLYEEPVCIAYGRPFDLRDLPNMPRVDYQSDYLIKLRLDKWWRENFDVPPNISMQVDKLATCKEMVRCGLGYALIPARIIADLPEINKAEIRDGAGSLITRKTWMIYNKTALDLPIVNRFVEFVKNSAF